MISKDAVIGFLIFSAVLMAIVLGLQMGPGENPAQAAGTTSRAGTYVCTTAAVDDREDLLWVLDVNAERLVILQTDRNGIIEDLARVDLTEVFMPKADGTTSDQRTRTTRTRR